MSVKRLLLYPETRDLGNIYFSGLSEWKLENESDLFV